MADRVTIAGVGVAEEDSIVSLSPSWETGPAPQITVTLSDRARVLQNSPLLSGAAGPVNAGKVPLADIITAEHAGTQWVAVSLTPGDFPVVVLEHWIASDRRGKRGPLNAKQGIKRPQFAKQLLGSDRWRLVIPEASGYKPPVLSGKTALAQKRQEKDRDVERAPGFASSASFKIGWPAGKATTATAEQKRILATAMSVCDDLKAPPRARLALICALIVESGAKNLSYGDSTSTGPLQLLASTARGVGISPNDVAGVCKEFLRNGYWRQIPKGAIELSKSQPGWSVGRIAQECQGSKYPTKYDDVAPQARNVAKAWGGGSASDDGSATTERKATFSVEKDGNYWEASGSLADEVNRRRFIGNEPGIGDVVFWVDELTLAKSRPYATLTPDDGGVQFTPGTLDELLTVDKSTAQLLLPAESCGQVIGRTLAVDGWGASDGVDWLVTKATRTSRSDRWITVDLERARKPLREPPKAVNGSTLDTSKSLVVQGKTDARSLGGGLYYPLGKTGRVIGVPYSGTHTLGNWQSDNAVDLGVPDGTALYAIEDGTVTKVGGSYAGGASRFDGIKITITGKSGRGYFYTHCKSKNPSIVAGAKVRGGQQIGRSGSANGVPHLHLGFSRDDPRKVLKL